MQWLKEVIAKYATFRGRARRREYWRFILFNLCTYGLLLLIDLLTGTFDMETMRGWLSTGYMFFVSIPFFAVAVRRLHDTGRSGYWMILNLLLFFGFLNLLSLSAFLVLLFFFIQEGDEGDNAYGPDPKFAQ